MYEGDDLTLDCSYLNNYCNHSVTIFDPFNRSFINTSGRFRIYNGISGVYRCVCQVKGQSLDYDVDIRKSKLISTSFKECPCYCIEIGISVCIIIVIEIIGMIVLIYRSRRFNYKSNTAFSNQII